MNVIFMGTPDFAVPCLEALIESKHNVLAVFSQPDKPVGRKQVLTAPAVKKCALEHDIPVFQPNSLKNDEIVNSINNMNADVIVVVAYGKILPAVILTASKYGCINVHASLLPKYRGAAPIQWAVLNGDKESGVTIMQMDEGLDTGDMLKVVKTNIGENETSEELFERLSVIGSNALIETLKEIENNMLSPISQKDSDSCYASKITKELSPINWTKSAAEIHNLVRGLQSWPCAATSLNGKQLKIHKTVKSDKTSDIAGKIVDNKSVLTVCCGDGKCIDILELQLEGKKRMDIKSFLQGNNIEIGQILGE
ncbi:MAG: methionyl-tRNA formyltransferase [Acetobacter sp.]|nr:methionyl-tRNA formyltransferase [Bacteroides sp.]MCM1340523.1 methionyl-tRNA formyltransferase [Acetobacter sp.]MCM1433263.1 methionyl-tRNA formyltransferase [Clostridiales bacterium]